MLICRTIRDDLLNLNGFVFHFDSTLLGKLVISSSSFFLLIIQIISTNKFWYIIRCDARMFFLKKKLIKVYDSWNEKKNCWRLTIPNILLGKQISKFSQNK